MAKMTREECATLLEVYSDIQIKLNILKRQYSYMEKKDSYTYTDKRLQVEDRLYEIDNIVNVHILPTIAKMIREDSFIETEYIEFKFTEKTDEFFMFLEGIPEYYIHMTDDKDRLSILKRWCEEVDLHHLDRPF